jgi:hypothetical protein
VQPRLFQFGYQDNILKLIKMLPSYQSSLSSDKIHQLLKDNSGAMIVPKHAETKVKNPCEFSIYFVMPKEMEDKRNHMLRLDFEVGRDGTFIFRENVPNQFAFLWDLYPDLANELIGIGVTVAKGVTSPVTSPKSASYSDDLSADDSFSPRLSSLSLTDKQATSPTSVSSLSLASETKQMSPSSTALSSSSATDFTEVKKPAKRNPVKFKIETLIAKEDSPNEKSFFNFQIDSDATVIFTAKNGEPAFLNWHEQGPLVEQFMEKFAHLYLTKKQSGFEQGAAHLVFEVPLDGQTLQLNFYVQENGAIKEPKELEQLINLLKKEHPEIYNALQNIPSETAPDEQKKPESKSF